MVRQWGSRGLQADREADISKNGGECGVGDRGQELAVDKIPRVLEPTAETNKNG